MRWATVLMMLASIVAGARLGSGDDAVQAAGILYSSVSAAGHARLAAATRQTAHVLPLGRLPSNIFWQNAKKAGIGSKGNLPEWLTCALE